MINDTLQLERLILDGEENVTENILCIPQRISLDIIAGTADYELPDYCRSINRVTWLGKKLYPMSERAQRMTFQNATQESTPFWYIYNNISANTIALFPVPNVSIADVVPTDTLWDDDIPTTVIVEFMRIADGTTYKIPSYARRQLLKKYFSQQSNLVDGPGQKLKFVAFYREQYKQGLANFRDHASATISRPRRLVLSSGGMSNTFPGAPVLPLRYGVSVDEGS